MNPNKICKNCEAWKPFVGSCGECRRHPPIANGGSDGRWPRTEATDGCMEFRKIYESASGKPGRPRGSQIENDVIAAMKRFALLTPCKSMELYRRVIAEVPVTEANFYRILGRLVNSGNVIKTVQVGDIPLYSLPPKSEGEPVATPPLHLNDLD